jgi:hypothetical protein
VPKLKNFKKFSMSAYNPRIMSALRKKFNIVVKLFFTQKTLSVSNGMDRSVAFSATLGK